MARKPRGKKLSADNAAQTYKDAMSRHEPPVNLDARELRVFDAVVGSREYATWSDYDLNLACKLTKTLIEMDRLWDEYEKSGEEETFKRWTALVNPMQRMSNMLGLTASQRSIKGEKQPQRNQKEIAARRRMASVSPLLK